MHKRGRGQACREGCGDHTLRPSTRGRTRHPGLLAPLLAAERIVLRRPESLRRVLEGHRPVDRDAMHQPALRQYVVFDRQVLGAAIVPHEEITDAPLMPV